MTFEYLDLTIPETAGSENNMDLTVMWNNKFLLVVN